MAPLDKSYTTYYEWSYLTLNNIVTMKSGLEVTQDYYVAHYVWPYHETVRMSVCPSVCLSVCHVSYLENGAR